MLSSVRKWAPALLGIILISPLFNLPRPINISSIPWRVELLFSAFLIVVIIAASRSLSFRATFETVFEDQKVRTVIALIIGFCLWSAVSTFWSTSPAAAIHHTLLWAGYGVVFLFAFAISTFRNGRSGILLAMTTTAILIGVLAAFDFLTIQDFSTQEGTLRIRYAKFAEMLTAIAPVLFSVAIMARSRGKFVAALIVGSAAWASVMLSLSKGAFLAGLAGFVLLFFFLALFKRSQFGNVAVAAAVWLTVTLIFQFGLSTFTSVPSTASYISGEADATRSTSDMRKYTWRVAGEMIKSNPVSGVGADNFGLEFNSARESFANSNPQDPDSAIGEYYVFERAHNELIQIFAELGVIGIALFGAFAFAAVIFLGSAAVHRGKHLSPIFFGGVAGMGAFACSSIVSSFSFRAYQNGIVFFMILGLTFSYARVRRLHFYSQYTAGRKWTTPLAFSAAVLLLTFSSLKAASQYLVYFGERNEDLPSAAKQFETASLLDLDNPGAELSAAEAFAREKNWGESVPHFRSAIDRGFGVSIVYSYLAHAQEMSGDLAAAESTLKESVAIFPRSSFLSVRLAIVNEKQGKFAEANEQFSIGRSYDERQTNGWYAVIKDGILNAHLKATADPKRIAAPPDLQPENAIHDYNNEKVQVD